jgi:hypothetical protein
VQVTEPVSGNYYPVTAVAAIADQQVTAAVITDRWEREVTGSGVAWYSATATILHALFVPNI